MTAGCKLTILTLGSYPAWAIESTTTGVNTLGGHGYLADHPQERHYRDATALAVIDFDPLVATGADF